MADNSTESGHSQPHLRWARADTVIYFTDGSRVEVPHGTTLSAHDGWVSVTDRVLRPDHPLSNAGQGFVGRTRTWPASSVSHMECIREELD